jgi:proteasome-associated ATPase
MNSDRDYADFGDPDGDPAGGGRKGDEFEEFESPYLRGDPEEEALRDFDEEPLRLVDQVLILLPDRDPSRPLLYQLRRQLMEREITFQEARRALVELEAALEKVTSPSNRVGICIDAPREGIATILVGGSEYFANVDPRVDPRELKVGGRVLINEAYAVVGVLPRNPAGPVVRITDVLPDGRLRIGNEHATSDFVLERAEELAGLELKAGDEVRTDASMRVALELLQSRESREYFLEEIPEMTWDRIGGQEEAIRGIRDTIELPAKHPELFEKFHYSTPKGFLLYGPPGCGKTLIGKATAYNLVQHLRSEEGLDVREYFMHVKGPEILNMWLGETERMVREIFAQARQKRKEGFLPFVFIDEAESILGTRRSMRSHHIANTVVPMFCTEMDGIESLQDVVIILASNRHDLIDPAILRPGRIDRKIKVLRPDFDASREIFGIYLTEDLPIDPREVERYGGAEEARRVLIDEAVKGLFARGEETRFLEVGLRSGRLENLHYGDLASGALIDSIVQRAKEAAIKRAIAESDADAGIRSEDLANAILSEYRENEVFPPTDSVEDWLKLLDYDPENVVRVAPVSSAEDRDREAEVAGKVI